MTTTKTEWVVQWKGGVEWIDALWLESENDGRTVLNQRLVSAPHMKYRLIERKTTTTERVIE